MKFCSFDVLNILKIVSASSIPYIFIFTVHFSFLQTETFIFNSAFHFNLSRITIYHQRSSKTNFSLLLNINKTKYHYIVLILYVWLNYIILIFVLSYSHLLNRIITNTFHLFHHSHAYIYCTIFFLLTKISNKSFSFPDESRIDNFNRNLIKSRCEIVQFFKHPREREKTH